MDLKQEVLARTGVELLHVIHTQALQQKWVKAGQETPEGKPVYYTVNVKPGVGVKFIHPKDGRTMTLGIYKASSSQPEAEYVERLCSLIVALIS